MYRLLVAVAVSQALQPRPKKTLNAVQRRDLLPLAGILFAPPAANAATSAELKAMMGGLETELSDEALAKARNGAPKDDALAEAKLRERGGRSSRTPPPRSATRRSRVAWCTAVAAPEAESRSAATARASAHAWPWLPSPRPPVSHHHSRHHVVRRGGRVSKGKQRRQTTWQPAACTRERKS